MKAKLLRDEEITHPQHKSPLDVKLWRAKLDRSEITPQEWRAGMFLQVKAGHVVDHPHAHMLVKMGMAEPFDEECRRACLQVDVDACAEAQDRTRNAQLTGDASLDRDDETSDDILGDDANQDDVEHLDETA